MKEFPKGGKKTLNIISYCLLSFSCTQRKLYLTNYSNDSENDSSRKNMAATVY